MFFGSYSLVSGLYRPYIYHGFRLYGYGLQNLLPFYFGDSKLQVDQQVPICVLVFVICRIPQLGLLSLVLVYTVKRTCLLVIYYEASGTRLLA